MKDSSITIKTEDGETLTIVAKNGKDGKSIVGPIGPAGKDGESIVGPAGKDADPVDEVKIIREVLRRIPIPENGKDGAPGKSIVGPQGRAGKDAEIDLEFIVEEVVKEIKKKRLDIKDIANAVVYQPKKIDTSDLRWHGGGISRITAGSNMTVTSDGNGGYVIASTGGSGSNTLTEKVTGIQSGTDITLDLTTLAHTPTSIMFVTRQGQIITPVVDWTGPVASIITVGNADSSEVFLVSYTY
jgi:hypothetical protein